MESAGICYESGLSIELKGTIDSYLPEGMNGLRWRVVEAARTTGLDGLEARMPDEVHAARLAARDSIHAAIDLYVLSLNTKQRKIMAFSALMRDTISVLSKKTAGHKLYKQLVSGFFVFRQGRDTDNGSDLYFLA